MQMQDTDDRSARSTVHKLIHTMHRHHHMFDQMREQTGLGRSAHRILMLLSDSDGSLSQTDLADALQISTAAVATTLKKMEADGYILRTANTADSRFNSLALTDAGQGLAAMSKQMFDRMDNAVFCGFDAQEMEQFNRYMDRIQANIRTLEESLYTEESQGGTQA